jgi:3-methyl-2-oxobutanoate hydroxymethyltransferase
MFLLGCTLEFTGTAPEAEMSAFSSAGSGRVTVPAILSRKTRLPDGSFATREKITCLTAYDYPTARLLDEAGIDILLIGDSLGMVVLGYETTLPVTLDEVLHHTRAVARAARHALVVADMPYGSFHVSVEDGLRNALRLVKEGGAAAVKLEGGERRLELIARLNEAEIPVMGHIGLTPQSFHKFGGFKVQGKSADAAATLLRDARAIEAAGAFSLVLESIPREIATEISRELRIPTIGIGAGPDCDGQVLVFHDLVGLSVEHTPKFARRYADLAGAISEAARRFADDVRAGDFPSDAESFHLPAELRERAGERYRS